MLQPSRRPARLIHRVLPIRHARETDARLISEPAFNRARQLEMVIIVQDKES